MIRWFLFFVLLFFFGIFQSFFLICFYYFVFRALRWFIIAFFCYSIFLVLQRVAYLNVRCRSGSTIRVSRVIR